MYNMNNIVFHTVNVLLHAAKTFEVDPRTEGLKYL